MRRVIYCTSHTGAPEIVYSVHVGNNDPSELPQNQCKHQFIVSFAPLYAIENLLPCTVQYVLSNAERKRIHSGLLQKKEQFSLLHPPVNQALYLQIKIPGYPTWSDPCPINGSEKNISINLFDDKKRYLKIHIDAVYDLTHTMIFAIYVPYWIVNKTGLPLLCKESLGIAPGQSEMEKNMKDVIGECRDYLFSDMLSSEPLLFSFKGKSQDLYVKVSDSHWSNPLSLNSQNTSGFVDVWDQKKI
eukprot:TRINITY_DN16663_c0_g1_i1.p1 TRINITY_DN16663_c0_g1~~TRINITY_DN16663_c0_g1_i1.p1  ORF type:complete len:244 (+),score=28.54 TRINITY_DN16663_c0_g1_i1:154-885(+)